MTRNIRKIVSILCAVSVLLSLCTVSFLGSSSAAVPAEDAATTVVWDQVALNLTFDGDNNGGIAMSNASGKEIKNGEFYLSNVGGNQGAAWLGKDASVLAGQTIPNKTNVGNAAQSPKANLFALKGDTTYRITFKYAFRNDTVEGKAIQFMAANDPYLFQNHGRGTALATYVASTEDAMQAKAAVPAGGTDYAVMREETYIFTTTASAEGKFLGFRTSSTNVYVKVDDFKIEVGSKVLANIENDYDFDFKNGETPYVALDVATALGNSTKHYTIVNVDGSKNADRPSYIDEAGYHIVSFTANPVTDGKQAWMNNAVIYDTDAVEGGTLKFKQGASYIVSVKYKLVDLGENADASLAITGNISKVGGECRTAGFVTLNKVSEDWQYLNVAFNADDANLTGKYLYFGVRSSAGKPAEWLVESVSVKEKRDTTNGVAIVETVNGNYVDVDFAQPGAVYNLQVPADTEDRGFAGWYTTADFQEGTKVDITNYIPAKGKNTLYAKWVNTNSVIVMNNSGVEETVKMAVGEKLPRPLAPDGNLFFEGWYTDLTYTTKITEVPDYDVTLYAKYNGVFLGFENIGYVAGQTSGSPILLADPTNPENQVMKFSSDVNQRPNFMLPAYDMYGVDGFELKTNTTYTYSFKARLVDPNGTAAGYQLYRGDFSSFADSTTTRTSVSGASGSVASGEWVTYTGTFTTGATHYLERVKWSYQNHLFFTTYNQTEKLEIYIDDFCIVEKLTSCPEGAVTIKMETNAGESEMYGYPNDPLNISYVPSLGGYDFVGWYADKNLTVPFTATTFPAQDTTIYAKWKTVPFTVDFSGYAKGTASARAKFVKDDKGNDYVDWHVDHADSNTADTNSAYRIFLNKNGTHYTVTKGTEYTIKFKYKLINASVNKVVFRAVTNGLLNGWSENKEQKGEFVADKVTDTWQEGKITFVADPLSDKGIYLSLGVANHGHVLIDDVVVECASATANLYGATKMFFSTNGGDAVTPLSGDPGEAIGTLPKATKAGYSFNGWFTDEECTTPFTGTVWGEEDITLYADWLLGKFAESYEDYPNSMKSQGIAGAYDLYNDKSAGFDKANVQNGSTSLFRKGETAGTKGFTLCRTADLKLTIGKQYTLTFYVKPTNVTLPTGTISLIGMKSNIGHVSPLSTNVITTLGDLTANEWQKVEYTFTADANYIGISTTQGNDMYLDNFAVTLKGYTGTTTGDESVNPIFIVLMVLLAAGSLVITGKKVFEK